jgi:hypothetical protein
MADQDRGRSVFELRPLNLADILDMIVRIYREHFGQLMGICAVVLAPLGVLQVLMTTSMISGVLSASPDDMATGTPPFAQVISPSPVGFVLMFVYMLLLALATPVMQAAVAKAIASYYLGAVTSFGAVYRFALRKWLTLIGVMLLMGLVVGGVAIVCMIPVGLMIGASGGMMGNNASLAILTGVMAVLLGLVALLAVTYVGTMLYFCGLIVVLEDSPAVAALQRSWSLVSGQFWRVFGTVLVLSLMVSIARSIMVYPIQFGLMLLGENMLLVTHAVTQGVGVVAQLLTFPLMIAGTVLLYYDLRIRKEGFDLAAMAEAIGQPELAVRTPTGEAAPALFGDTSPLVPPPPPPPMPPPPHPPTDQPEEASDGPPD